MKRNSTGLFIFVLLLFLVACGVPENGTHNVEEETLPPAAEEDPIEYDKRCELYLKVLEDLWNVDSALNHEAIYLGFDFTQTSLADADITHIAETFASAHDATPLIGTSESLAAEGYLTLDDQGRITRWDDGLLLSVAEHEDGTFSVWKWRSSLGAYAFSKCIASGDGAEYTIGAEMIS